MQVPHIGHTQFLILSALADGRPRTVSELVARLNWDKCRETIIKQGTALHKFGLIAKVDELLTSGRTRRVYLITDEGRIALRECSDFYLSMIDKFQRDSPKPPESAAVLSRREVKTTSEAPGSPERIATPEEFERLMMHADERFARCYRLVWTLNASDAAEHFPRGISALEIVRLQIADANLAAGTITIQGRRVMLDDASREAIRQAAGDRRQGPLFLSSGGSPYHTTTLAGCFRKAARKAGLPADVKMIGRGNSWRHRQNAKQ